ncbi:hypothetical protein B0H13DRAFT_2309429 [Mycena leptocephala]|nr:hypothetical protein B0H13DRAFT_2309429 [Mycena leptocephala]
MTSARTSKATLRFTTYNVVPAHSTLISSRYLDSPTSSTSSARSPSSAPAPLSASVPNSPIFALYTLAAPNSCCTRLVRALLNPPTSSFPSPALHRSKIDDRPTSTRSPSIRADKSLRSFRTRTDTQIRLRV